MHAWPHVTVQLPIYNELYVAERLINAVARLDYPADLLEIQVLDDSTDETVEVVHRTVGRLRAGGVNIVHLHRTHRGGFKAGALAEGLACAHGEFLAIFDADFVPPPDFLKWTLPYFQNPRIAFVQTRWGHVNRDYSFLTFLQSLTLDAHFVIEQFARCNTSYWFNFNGTAGVWRRAALEDAGGWTADTLTEDLDLSYRAFLRGWQALYLRDVQVPAELPVSFSAYRRQQRRWASGSFQVAMKLIPPIWRAPVPLSQKLEATLHLTSNSVYILLCMLALLYPLVLALTERYSGLVGLFGVGAIFNTTMFVPSLYFLAAQRQLGRPWQRILPRILLATAVGSGMMLNTAQAVFLALRKRHGVFERTPKFGIAQKEQGWIHQRYQLRLDTIAFFELGFALWNFGTTVFALHIGNWVIAAYSTMFCIGLLFTSGMTVAQAIAVHWHRSLSAPPLLAAGK
jgi:cellulose synthase/poly-beta-1,6-N-acetylglucosamine synthase-like glycosyltransferase